MPVPDFAHGIQISFLDSATRARMQSHAQAAAAGTPASTNTAVAATGGPASGPPLTFDDLLDVVNPLQHLPIVSTLYRHYAHDEIKPLPKIAGDALYGGWMGLASSVADYAFEKFTGKSFGDTVLALVTGDEGQPTTAVASTTATAKSTATATSSRQPIPALSPSAAPPTSQAPEVRVAAATRAPLPLSGAAQPIPTIDAATLDAFMTAVNNKGLPGDLGQRTVDAYRRSVGLQGQPATAAQTLH